MLRIEVEVTRLHLLTAAGIDLSTAWPVYRPLRIRTASAADEFLRLS